MSNKITPADGVEPPGADNAAFTADPSTNNQEPSEASTPENEQESAEKTGLDVEVVISDQDIVHDKPYSGMGKDDLIRFSDTTFWNRFRLISVLLFWAAWLALLGAVIGLTIVAPRCSARPTPEWWQKSTIYQIYVRSFFDSDANGVGDIPGVTSKLDYLQELKVDAILLSSVYTSNHVGPADFGYEITDHKNIDPIYGTLANIEELIEGAHNRSISVLLDFIPNYTGLSHNWFVESSRNDLYTNPYWNYYVWAACGPTGPPPNNWRDVNRGSAWTRDATRGACYLHQFLPEQPELNLRSSAVQEELIGILKFWLDKGVDGFKVSSTAYLFESSDFQDEPPSCTTTPSDCRYTRSQPETVDIVKRWRTFLEEYSMNSTDRRTRILITDSDISGADTLTYYGSHSDGSHLPINYQLSAVDYAACDGQCMYDLVRGWINGLPRDATPDWLNGDQDRSRTGTQAGEMYVNALNLLKMTLPGTAIIYYGEEIGMRDYPQGPPTDRYPQNRYAYRGPMQWTNETEGGFTTGDSWLDVDPTSAYNNVMNQSESNVSPLGIFKALAALRAGQDSLQYGKTHFVSVENSDILAFVREQEGFDRLLVVINFGMMHAHNVNVAKGGSDIKIPNKAVVVLGVNEPMYNNGNEIDLRSVMLDGGQGFIAKWEYTRPQ